MLLVMETMADIRLSDHYKTTIAGLLRFLVWLVSWFGFFHSKK